MEDLTHKNTEVEKEPMPEGEAKKAMEADKEILKTGKGTRYVINEDIDDVMEYLELIKRPVFDEEGKVKGIIALINNVTDVELLKMELEKRSKTDSLTGLLNKGAMEDLSRAVIESYDGKRDRAALMMIDLDYFKEVNDTYGHAVGDHVLATVGRLIFNSFKGKDVVGRVGGDEFMVLLRDIDSPDSLKAIANNLGNAVRHAFDEDPFAGCTSFSIGIARYPDDGKTFEQLYESADKALYSVKEHGRDGFRLCGE